MHKKPKESFVAAAIHDWIGSRQGAARRRERFVENLAVENFPDRTPVGFGKLPDSAPTPAVYVVVANILTSFDFASLVYQGVNWRA